MKATLKVQGTMELGDQDLFDILKEEAAKNRQALTPLIVNYIKSKFNYSNVKVQYPEVGLDKIAVIIDSVIDEGATPIGVVKDKIERASNKGFVRKWNGLYGSIGEVINTCRARKKRFISWEDLRAELLEFEDAKGKKMFIADGQEIPMDVIKQRCAPSQLARIKANIANFRGVKYEREKGGLSFQ